MPKANTTTTPAAKPQRAVRKPPQTAKAAPVAPAAVAAAAGPSDALALTDAAYTAVLALCTARGVVSPTVHNKAGNRKPAIARPHNGLSGRSLTLYDGLRSAGIKRFQFIGSRIDYAVTGFLMHSGKFVAEPGSTETSQIIAVIEPPKATATPAKA